MLDANREQTVGELLSTLARDTGVLVRQEVQLASTEIASKTTHAARAVGMIGTAGAVIHAGVLMLLIALFIGLGTVVPLWASALIVGVAVTALGYGLLQRGITALKELDPLPRQAIQTIQRDAVWAKEQVR